MPIQYTCSELDISPHISWSKVESAKSFAIIMDHPDAPIETFTHWIVYDIPSNVLEILSKDKMILEKLDMAVLAHQEESLIDTFLKYLP